jgi:hypothetical protein
MALASTLTPRALAFSFAAWELLYHIVRLALSTPRARSVLTPIVRRDAPSYVVSTVHAVFAAARGARHVVRLWAAPAVVQLHIPAAEYLNDTMSPFLAEARTVVLTNTSLAGYLLSDLFHVVVQFPNLGRFDTITHHAAFLLCALVAGAGNLFPYVIFHRVMPFVCRVSENIR